MQIRQTIGRLCILLGCICVLVAVGLLVHNAWAEQQAAQASASALAAITAQLGDAITNDDSFGDGDAAQAQTPAERSATNQTIVVEDSSYCGVLSIASLGLTLPVQAEFSYLNLKSSPCLYPQDGYDAIVIAAHNYTAHFGSLPQLSIGDSLSYTPIGQNAIVYTVTEISTVDASDLQTVQGTADELILFTCNINNNTQRVVVRCQMAS